MSCMCVVQSSRGEAVRHSEGGLQMGGFFGIYIHEEAIGVGEIV
jgi:hypothetical protein